AWRPGPEPFTSAVPRKLLPPARGMAFMMTPLVLDSADWPESWTSTCSNRSGDRLMLVRFELRYMLPIRRPSTIDTPSPFRLPCGPFRSTRGWTLRRSGQAEPGLMRLSLHPRSCPVSGRQRRAAGPETRGPEGWDEERLACCPPTGWSVPAASSVSDGVILD